MGGHKLKYSSVKGYKRKRKEAKLAQQNLVLAKSTANSSMTNDQELVISLPLSAYTSRKARSLLNLYDCLNKCGGISDWQVVEATAERLSLVKIAFIPSPCIAVTIQIYSSFEYSVTIGGFPFQLSAEDGISSHVLSVDDLSLLLSTMNSFHLCEGNLCSEFCEVVAHNKGKFLGTDRKTVTASIHNLNGKQTIRHCNCQIAVREGVVRCHECAGHRKTLQSANLRLQKKSSAFEPSHSNTSPSSHTNYKYLTTPETSLRVQSLRRRFKASKKTINRLQAKVQQLLDGQGVNVETSLHEDLVAVMDQHESEVCSNFDEESFQALFWKQQRQALGRGTNVRWHPLMIKFCLYLHHCSSKAYKMLQSSKCLCLPSQRTLRDYTHFNTTGAGFSAATDDQLKQYAKLGETPNCRSLVGLLFDEMHIKEGLVFNKNTGNLIGFVELGDVNDAFVRYSNSESSSQSELPLAKSVLFIMVRGLTSDLTFAYAQFPVESLKGSQLFPLFWEAVHRLECIGFHVLSCTCDGATSNRRLYHLLTKSENDKYKVLNKYSKEDRFIYLISDPPHLIKTMRNCFASRPLWCCGEEIRWQHVVDLYHRNTGAGTGLAIAHKLKYEHIHLTSFSKMRVDLAAQVLSESVAQALKMTGGPIAQGTATFIGMADKFFDCLNVDNLNEGKEKRKKFQEPYTSKDDVRLKWLSNEFTSYLENWKKSVEARRGYNAQQKQRNLLSDLTLEGISITVSSFVELVPYILSQPGVKYFLSEKICQDPLEKYFGCQRQRGKTNDNPTVAEVFKNTDALRVIGNININSFAGNCRGKKSSSTFVAKDTSTLQKREKTKKQ